MSSEMPFKYIEEFGVTAIVGTLGSGKTALQTYLLEMQMAKGMKVYANYKLDGAEPINNMMDIKEYSNCFTGLDDAISWFDSRSSQSNKANTYTFINFRKRGVNAMATFQVVTGVDLRFRNLVTLWCFPWLIKFPTFGVEWFSPSGRKLRGYKITFPDWVFKAYNTHEQIFQVIKMEEIKDLAREIGHKDTFSDICNGRYNIQKTIGGNVYEMVVRNREKYAVEILQRNGFSVI